MTHRWRFASPWLVGVVLALTLTLPACTGEIPCPGGDGDGDGLCDIFDPCPTNPDLTCIPAPTPGVPHDCANPPALTGLVKVRHPIADRYIVVRKAVAGRLSVASAAGFAARFNAQEVQYLNVRTLAMKVAKDKIAALVADPSVQYVVQEQRVHLIQPKKKAAASVPWDLDRIDARKGLDGLFVPYGRGKGVHVVINDTGVTEVSETRGRVSPQCFSTVVFRGCEDGHGHGTFVSTEAAGLTLGVLSEATIHSLRFLGNDGSGTSGDAIRALEEAIKWKAADPEGLWVLNASWGGDPDPAIGAAVCRVIEAGIPFIAAAGNESGDAYNSSPANVVQVITALAMDRDDKMADFSNRGEGIDVGAPGVDVIGMLPSGATEAWDGTSMAAPLVTAAAGLYLEAHPKATVAEVHEAIVATSTKDVLSGLPEGTPNRLLFVGKEGGTEPGAGPKVVDGRFVPFLRYSTNCCDYDGTPDVDEGLADGWVLVTPAALDRISGPQSINGTHVRSGPYSAEVDPGVLSTLSTADAKKARGILSVIKNKYGPGPAILPYLRTSLQAVRDRALSAEADLVDCWALATRGMNYFGDDCSITQAAPPERYLDWARQVVDASWDMPVIYNLGNECGRCRPSEEWERGIYDATKAALKTHGVDRPVGSTVTLDDTRTTFDYRTYHGFISVPEGWPRDVPTMLSESDNDSHSPAEWVALAAETEARGGYLSVWRGPDSWETQNAAIAALPKLGGEPPPPPPPACDPVLDPSMLPPLDNDTDWTVVEGAQSVRRAEVNAAILAAQTACPSGWASNGPSGCLSAGPPGIDNGFAQVAAQLHAMGIKAGQPYVEGEPGRRTDTLSVAGTTANYWEAWHLFFYGDGCLISGSPYKGTWLYTGDETGPGTCSSPLTPKVDRWGGPKPHLQINDSTPLFYNRETQRWDGSTVTGYCDSIGFTDRLHCPARSECPGFKCEEREPCEQIGVSGIYGGKPLWRSDGEVILTDNPYQATCSSCTWLEVCAADGTVCSRCQIDQQSGLCEAQ